ncbi:crotonase/enoyl-CoA hydratase family protein [Arenibacterium halophilum]|uniref:Crotonase/enoyl-CoA hydratase family protein n=1 Tax=Arenibacterium halophilum TaxID=2583821 RepID=A0ABY2XCX4_9RHOB|nr:crotonase/enoyl-CoA hydratase family protein [Arenibacterium halophilum]TMV14819.1 crotonase/enoyl-CoA hydratase family protein [Arenibacterium halophilum]
MFETIRLTTDARGVARLTLARAEKHNAMSAQMIAELTEVAGQIAVDSAIRVVVLDAEGKSFCAGGDLRWMQAQMEADRDTRFREARKLAEMLFALNTLPQPLIGAVQGNAFGGGMGLISVCDVAIAAEGAKFGFTETRLGLIPATISPYCLARMGEAMARRVFMSARLFDGAEAMLLGLLSQVVAHDALEQAVEAEVVPYLSCAPTAVAASKRLARRLGPVIDDAVIDDTIRALAEQWETEEARAGVAAFFAREKAPWITA